MKKLPKKRHFKIKETAQLLGVSTKTLRRWDQSGRLKPKRKAKNNYRYYTYSQIEKTISSLGKKIESDLVLKSKPKVIKKIARTSPEIQELIVGIDRVSRIPRLLKIITKFGLLSFFLDRISKLLNPSRLPLPHLQFSKRQGKIILASAITTFSSIYTTQSLKAAHSLSSSPTPSVLGITDEALTYNFKVNVPSVFGGAATFNQDVEFNEKALFNQSISAPNILYSLRAVDDSGIQVEGIQDLVVTNTDRGSEQSIFKSVQLNGSDLFSASNNTDFINIKEGSGIDISGDSSNNSITLTVDSNDLDIDIPATGWTDGGTSIYATTITDKVGIGTTAPTTHLHVVGDTLIAPTESGVNSLTVRASTTLPGDVFKVQNSDGTTDFFSISSDGSMTVNGSTLTNAGILEAGNAIHLTDLENTIIGTAVEGAWSMGGNTFTWRRRITVENTDGAITLPKNYEVTIALAGAESAHIINNTQVDNDDFRTSSGTTEIGRNISSYSSTDVTFTFQLQADISPSSSSSNYYIYYKSPLLDTSGPNYIGNVQVDDADTYTDWVSADSEDFISSQETTIKQEGTGSTKLQATTGNFPTISTSSQNALPQNLSGHTSIASSITSALYTIGGENDGTPQNTVYKSTIDGSGNIGAHSTASQGQLPQALSDSKSLLIQEAPASGDGTDGIFDLSNDDGADGCDGTHMTWNGGTSTCTLNTNEYFKTGPTTTQGASHGSHTITNTDGTFTTILGTSTTVTNIYNESTNTFTAGPSLDTRKAGYGGFSFQRADGNYVVILGSQGSGDSVYTNIYNPTTKTFSLGPNLVVGAYMGAHAFERPDGKFMVLPGDGNTGTNIYDPGTNTFSAGPTSSGTYYGSHTIPMTNGDFLVMRGSNSQTTSVYDPDTNTFSAGPSTGMNIGMGAHSFQRGDGKWIVITSNLKDDTRIYDPTANTFSAGPELTERANDGTHSFQLLNGDWMVVIGGLKDDTNIYDETNNTFHQGPNLTSSYGNSGDERDSHSFERADGKRVMIYARGSSNTDILDIGTNTYNFTQLDVPVGYTLTSSQQFYAENNTELNLLVSGDTTIAGTIDLEGKGYLGAYGQSVIQPTGSGPGGGGQTPANSCFAGGGGGANGGDGGLGQGGASNGTAYTGDFSGSGGGSAPYSNQAGSGGGYLKLISGGSITISGSINTNGTNAADSGGQPGGGGGAGGTVDIESGSTITVSGSITADGGQGEESCNYSTDIHGGGGGGGGRIYLKDADGSVAGTITVLGGDGPSTRDGSAGTVTQTSPPSVMFALGGNNAGAKDVVYKSTLDGSGNIGAFSTVSQSQLPQGIYQHTAHAQNIGGVYYAYVIGGNNDSSDLTTVYKSTLSSNNVGAWSTSGQGQLPTALSSHASAIATIGSTNYLYVSGGSSSSTAQTTVYKATIDSSGNIGSLSTSGQGQLPTALYDHQMITATIDGTDYIYLVGGNTGSSSSTTVYRATIDGSGNISSWTATAQDVLPTSLENHQITTTTIGSNIYAYSIGGNNGSSDVSSVYKGTLDPTDMTNYIAAQTLSSAIDFSNKNSLQFETYSSQTGSFVSFQFSEDDAVWNSCVFTVNSADTWETKTCDLTGVAEADRDAVLYIRFNASGAGSSPYLFYLDDINVLTSLYAGASPTVTDSGAILGAADLTINAQGSGKIKMNYDAVNGFGGFGGLDVYNGATDILFTVKGTGRTGLGVATPSAMFEVTGTTSNNALIIFNETGGQDIIAASSSGIARMTLSNIGHLGLGDVTPDHLLDIDGGYQGNALVSLNETLGNDILTASSSGITRFTVKNDGTLVLTPIATSSSTLAGSLYYDSDDNRLMVYRNGNWSSLESSPPIVVAASNSQSKHKADYICDGTDDDVTIETAIAALPTGGGKIVLLEGTYSIGDTAGDGVDIIKSNVTIEGQGDATILQRQANTAAVDGIITIGDGGTTAVSGITISSLVVDGKKPTYTSTLNAGVYLNKKVTYSTIENTYIENNSGYGIYSFGSSGIINEYIDITNNNFLGNGTYSGKPAIDTSYTDNTTIANNTISDNNFTGITISSSAYNKIINNTVYKTIYISYSTNNTVSNNLVIGASGSNIILVTNNSGTGHNIIQNNNASGGSGISTSGDYQTISGNIINSTNYHGMFFRSSNSVISGNFITLSGAVDGINVGGGADNNIITGNNIYGASGNQYGINISSSNEDNNYISGNEIHGGGWTAKINDSGTGTTIQERDLFQIDADGEIALSVEGSSIGQALVQLDETGDQAIFTASSSGTLQFVIANDGNVGLGVAEPTHKLEVEGAVVGQALMSLNETGDQDIFTASASGTTRFTIANGGNVGIGTAAPAYALDVLASGTGIIARFNSDNSSGCTLADGGTISCTSDERLKENIESLSSSALDQVMDLRAVAYDWKARPGEYKNLGFIAQEVESIVPGLVSTDEATGYKQLNTIGMVPLLTKALQEQQGEIETLKLEFTSQGELISNSTYLKQVASDVDSLRIDQNNLISSILGIKDEVSSTASNAAEIKEDVEGVKDQLAIVTDLINMLSSDATGSATFTQTQSTDFDLGIASLEGFDYTKTATFSSILVSGDTVLNNLGITGSLTTGTLALDGFTNTIKSVGFEPLRIQPSMFAGIEFINGKITMDTIGNLEINSGVIKGNDTFRGQIILKKNTTSIHVDQSWTETPVSIQTTPTFETNTWITDIDITGFTIHSSSTSSQDQKIHWLAIW